MADPAPNIEAQLAAFFVAMQSKTARYGVDPNDLAANVTTLLTLLDAHVDHRVWLITGLPP